MNAENKDLNRWDDQILPRDGTTIAETEDLDRWDDAGDVRFVFGYEAHDCLKELADSLPAEEYSFLERPPRYQIKTAPRQQPERVKPEIVSSAGSRRSIFSKRGSPSSTIVQSHAGRAIA